MIENDIIENVLDDACTLYGVSLEDLQSGRRFTLLVEAKRYVSHSFRDLGMSYYKIAKILHKDHTTIMNLVKKRPDFNIIAFHPAERRLTKTVKPISKYDHLFEEKINPGKNYQDYLQVARRA